MSIDYEHISKKIKLLRKEAGLTQEQLSEMLGVTPGYISKLECYKSHHNTKPNLEMLSNLSIAFNCSITDFFDDVVLERDDYLNKNFVEKFSKLSKYDRNLALDFIDLLIKRQQ
ncbi:MAG: helix-turn-helix transcriptional regulator [Clostridiales bacterium]|nr:helix-turn-helix transcriptional regulator [Clostridiales bacterium]